MPLAVESLGGWHKAAIDEVKKLGSALSKEEFIQGLPDALFPADFPHTRPPRTNIPEAYVAEGLFAALTSPQSSVVTKERMKFYIGEWYDQVDAEGEDGFDRRQLTNALRELITR